MNRRDFFGVTGGGLLVAFLGGQYRKNESIEKYTSQFTILTREHYYHVGASEKNRNPMLEAIVLNYNSMIPVTIDSEKQLALFEKPKEEYTVLSSQKS